MAFPTGSTAKKLTIESTKVSGSSNLTNFPVLVKDSNIQSEVYSALSLGSYSLSLSSASSQHASITDASQTGLEGMTDLSIEAWIKVSSIGVFHTIVSKYDTGISANRAYRFFIDTSNKLNLNWSDGSIFAGEITNNDVFSDKLNKWVHVSATIDTSTSTAKIYINGGVVSSTQNSSGAGITSIGTGGATFRIGARDSSGTPGLFLDGKVKNVRVFSDVRTDSEVIEGMNSASITDANLEGEWKLENSYADTSGNGNTLTASGSPVFSSTDVPNKLAELRFTSDSAGTTEIPFEIVSLDTAAETCEIWAKVPTVSYNTDTDFYMWYGDATLTPYAATDTYGSQNVWSSGYKAVYPFQETGGTRYDSTANANNLTDVNTVLSGTGKIGNGADFELSNGEYLYVADNASLDISTAIHMETWVNAESITGTHTLMIKGRENNDNTTNYALGIDSSGYVRFYYYNGSYQIYTASTNAITTASLIKITVDFTFGTGSSMKIKVNDTLVTGSWTAGTGNVAAVTNAHRLQIGTIRSTTTALEFWDGIQDNNRIYAGTLSDDWETTEYNNQNSPSTFLTMSDVSSARRIFLIT